MQNYLEVIKIAILVFPFVAFLISLPFILSQYHKYGSISTLKVAIIYSFVLYLTCAYLLVILPLPSFDEVAALTTPRTQLIPFKFVSDFVTHTSLNVAQPMTYLRALTESYFYVPIYNILLTLPLGIYLRYYFKCSLGKTILISFLLSLFFELTQLTGLYFIYPRGYRLFDVDDLILNTLGGLVGYFVAAPIMKILPSRETLDAEAQEKGKVVSGLRRTVAFGLDLILYGLLCSVMGILFGDIIRDRFIMIGAFLIYYFIIPSCLRGATLAEKFLNLSIVTRENNYVWWRVCWRRVVFLLLYWVAPGLVLAIAMFWRSVLPASGIITTFLVAIVGAFYIVVGLKLLFTNKIMWYEELSQTRLASTISGKAKKQSDHLPQSMV